MALKAAARKLLKSDKEVRLDPFDVVSRTRTEHHGDLTSLHVDVEFVERAHDPKFYLFNASYRAQQLQLLVLDPNVGPTPKSLRAEAVAQIAGELAHGAPDMPVHLGGVFPAYLTSMLVMFVQAATRPESPHLLAVEGRLERLERAVRLAAAENVEETLEVDWNQVEAALLKAAQALGWHVAWTIDREKSEVVGQVSGVDYKQLARQKLDFYEQVASVLDRETFKAVSFDLEPAE